MKKKIIVLCISVLAVVGLFAAQLFLSSLGEKPIDIHETLKVSSLKESEIDSVTVKNADNEYTAKTCEINNKKTLRIEGFEKIPAVESNFENLLRSISPMVAKSNLGEDQNNQKYGLDQPVATIDIRSKSGKIERIIIGNDSPDKSGKYAKLLSKDTVYLIDNSVAAPFLQVKDDYFSRNFFDVYTNEQVLQVNQITLGGTVRNKEITIDRLNDDHSMFLFKMVSPISSYCNDEKVAEFCVMLTLSFAAEDIEVFNPNDEELKKYGFDNPYSTAKFDFDEKSEYIAFGKKAGKDGKIYAMANDIPAIYRLSKSEFDFYDYTLDTLKNDRIFSCKIGYLKSFSVTKDSKTIKVSDKELKEDSFKDYYESFLKVNRKSQYSGEKAGDKVMEVSLSYTDNRKKTKIEYYKNGGKYYCFIDDKSQGEVSAEQFNHFFEYGYKK